MKKIFLVKTGFKNLKPADKVTEAKNYVSKMTGNSVYPTPSPALSAIDAKADELSAALAALDGSHEKTAIKNQIEGELDVMITTLSGYVQSAPGGDEVKILSSGMSVRNASTPVGLLGPVDKLTAKIGKMPRTIVISWGRIKKSKVNVIGICTDLSTDTWEMAGETTKSKFTAIELISGQTYYFRVACIGTAGLGPWSEIIVCKAY